MRVIILITCPEKKEAVKIAKALLAKKLVACVNIIDRVESFFRWKGRIDRARECLLIAKTDRTRFDKVVGTVKSLHSYEVPEIIALNIAAGSKTYLDWIDDSIR